MRNLIPHFIHEQFKQGVSSGEFQAVALFVDISGFTPLAETLMQHGKDGAEVLSDVLNSIFAPLVAEVYAHGGLITTFAGDAFTGLFKIEPSGCMHPLDMSFHALHVAFFIQNFFTHHGLMKTRYGQFQMGVKVGISAGDVQWQILGTEGCYTFFFKGIAIDGSVQCEHHATTGDIIVDATLNQIFDKNLVYTVRTLPDSTDYFKVFMGSEQANDQINPIFDRNQGYSALTRADLIPFIPDQVLDLRARGEFRDVVCLFISFQISAPTNRAGQLANLNHFVSDVLRFAQQYGGTFNQLDFGDKGGIIVMLFGAPSTHENDLERAAEFILALQCHDADASNQAVRWRAGITYGTVYAGFRGGEARSEYSAIGDVMNFAARIVMKSEWGEARTSQAVYENLRDSYRFESLGTFRFKGKSGLLPIYKLIRRKDHQEAAREFTRYTGRMVGRDPELTQLQAFIAPVYSEFHAGKFAGIATIYGDAGMGKSRLIYELQETLRSSTAGTARDLLWLECPTEEILRQSLNPFKRCLYNYFAQSSHASTTENRHAFEQKLAGLRADLISNKNIPNEELALELTRIRSVLAAFVNLHWEDSLYERLDPELRFDNMLAAFKSLIKAESLRQPVIIVLEDAQWLDADSLTMLRTLVHNVADYPIAVLIVSRYQDDGSPFNFLSDDLSATIPQLVIPLNALTSESVPTFVEQVLRGPICTRLQEFLLQKTEGNPFFIEQLALELRERGNISVVDDVWTLRVEDATDLPTTINAVLVARLDRLITEVRQVVQTASVLGREFVVQVLSLMLQSETPSEGREPPNISDAVQQAEAEGIWDALTELSYLFHHALLRDTAYNMQLHARLRELHALAASAIQHIYTANLAPYTADLAYHYDRAEQYIEAAHWYRLAGERSAAQYANAEAVTYLNRALDLTPAYDQERRYAILAAREKVYDLQGNRTAQYADLEMLERLASILGDAQQRITVRLRRAEYAEVTGDYPQAIAAARDAVQVAEETHNLPGEIEGHLRWGRGLWRQGNFTAAQAQLEQALMICKERGGDDCLSNIRPLEAECLNNLGIVALKLRTYVNARSYFKQALTGYQELGELRGTGKTLNNLGTISLYQNDYPEAEDYFSQALEIFHEIGARRSAGIALGNMGLAAFNRLDRSAAQNYYERALHIRREIGDRLGESILFNSIGIMSAELGDYAGAEKAFKQAVQIRQTLGDSQGQAQGLNNLGKVFMELGLYAEARNYCTQALNVCLEIGDRQTELEVLNNLGSIAYRQYDYDAGQWYMLQALKTAQVLEDKGEWAAALTVLGHTLAASGQLTESQTAYQEALTIRRALQQPHMANEPLAGLAHLAFLRGDHSQALAYAEEILAYLDTHALEGNEDPYQVYAICTRVLRANDDARADNLLAKAHALLMKRAEQIEDPNTRHTFLDNVPSHREIIQMRTNT
ncbi:MAG: tetratricopeptide repeat protein [Anaerolineae bacterium]|nr:tetratricopeptide repeat protein [Anaerolineae bacterium]